MEVLRSVQIHSQWAAAPEDARTAETRKEAVDAAAETHSITFAAAGV